MPSIALTSGAAILVIIALVIGALALAINAQTGWRFGTTPAASWTFAGLAVAGDVLAISLPAAAVALWNARHRVLALAAWILAGVALTGATLASLGYAELHVADTAAGRAAVVTTSTAATNQREGAITAARLAATAATKAREAECQIRGPRCRDREADERAALAALTTAIAAPVPAVATIADPDPQITAALRLATWAGFKLTADDFVNLRLFLMATLKKVCPRQIPRSHCAFSASHRLLKPERARACARYGS